MPRLPRQDFPGALHHVMARGIERRRIFIDDEDRVRFLKRLASILLATGTRCLAFALMPNHYHLLLETGATRLSRFMLRLGTCHGMDFNRRHSRAGHVFQNRFKSRLVLDASDMLTVVGYIHLNPVRARIVESVQALAVHPWTGHAALMGQRRADFLDASSVLRHFSGTLAEARRELARWMQERLTQTEPGPEFADGAGALPAPPHDELRDSNHGDTLEREVECGRLRDAGWDLDRVLLAACRRLGVDPAALRTGRRTAPVSLAREAVAGLAVTVLLETQEAIARATGVRRQSIAEALDRFASWPAEQREEIRGLFASAPPRD